MAFLHPSNIPSRNDVPERLRKAARAFRDLLGDEVTVWLERTGDGHKAALLRDLDPEGSHTSDESEPYLILLARGAGMAVLEVPEVSRRKRSVLGNRKIDPDQLHRSIAGRADELRERLNAASIDPGRAVHILALPDTSRHELEPPADLRALYREDFTAAALPETLRRLIGEQHRPLSEQQETAARVAVKPSIRIGGPAGGSTQGALLFRPPDDESRIRALDRDQERLAEHLGSGYRLIRGVAGSGKTLVLTHRAKHLSSYFPDWRILLCCYNKSLAAALKHEVAGADNVSAITVDSLATRLLKAAGRSADRGPYPSDEDFRRVRREAAEVAPTLPARHRFDVVLVDEAQDFGPSGLDLAWAALADGRDSFIIALDSAQNVYRRRMTWNPPGLTARGRSSVLTSNYRNTREILDTALGTLAGIGQSTSHDPDSDSLDVLVMPSEAVRNGPPPQVLTCTNLEAEARVIATRVDELQEAGNERDQIVVLSGWPELRKLILERVPDSTDTKRNPAGAVRQRGSVRVATLHWAKGLEFRHVIVGGANHVWVPEADDDPEAREVRQRRLLYMAMTRATETLTVTCSGEGLMNSFQRLPSWDPSL